MFERCLSGVEARAFVRNVGNGTVLCVLVDIEATIKMEGL